MKILSLIFILQIEFGFFIPMAKAEITSTSNTNTKIIKAKTPNKNLIVKKSKKKKASKTQKPKPMDVEVEPPPQKDVAEILYPEEIGEKVSHLVVGLANRLDSFFGEVRSDDEKNGSTLRIVPSHTFYDGRKGVSELGVNLNLKLINLENKVKDLENRIREAILGPDDTMKTENGSNSKLKPTTFSPQELEPWHYNFESKLASRPAIYYSGKFRARKNFERTLFLHHFSYEAGWDTDDRWSQKLTLFSDNALEELVLLRMSNEVSWFMTRDLIQTVHGPSLIKTINKYNSVSYNFRITFGNESNVFHHLNTNYSINYRHGTPSKRIFIDLIPAYSYPRIESYKEVRSIELRLEYLFGDIN